MARDQQPAEQRAADLAEHALHNATLGDVAALVPESLHGRQDLDQVHAERVGDLFAQPIRLLRRDTQ